MAAVKTDVVASASVRNGRLWIRNRRQFDEQIRQFREGVEVEVEVTIRRSTRSQQQNRYWWGVCVELVSEHTGYSPDEVHEIAKQMFIPKRLAVCDGNGEVKGEFVVGGSTRGLNTVEFSEFVEAFKRWAAETLDLYIPDADECAL